MDVIQENGQRLNFGIGKQPVSLQLLQHFQRRSRLGMELRQVLVEGDGMDIFRTQSLCDIVDESLVALIAIFVTYLRSRERSGIASLSVHGWYRYVYRIIQARYYAILSYLCRGENGIQRSRKKMGGANNLRS